MIFKICNWSKLIHKCKPVLFCLLDLIAEKGKLNDRISSLISTQQLLSLNTAFHLQCLALIQMTLSISGRSGRLLTHF